MILSFGTIKCKFGFHKDRYDETIEFPEEKKCEVCGRTREMSGFEQVMAMRMYELRMQEKEARKKLTKSRRELFLLKHRVRPATATIEGEEPESVRYEDILNINKNEETKRRL